MRLLTHVMVREMLLGAGLATAALLGLITLGRMLQLRDLFLVQGVSVWQMFSLFLYLTPFFLTVLMPAAAMLAIYLTVTRMAADREIMALRAAGVGLGPLMVPALGLCVLAAAITMWAGMWGVSWGMERFRETVVEMARQRTILRIQPGIFTQAAPGITIYARDVSPQGGEIRDVFLHDASRSHPLTISARHGHIGRDTASGRLLLRLQEGMILQEGEGGVSRVTFRHYVLSLDIAAMATGLRLGETSPKEMGWQELWRIYQEGSPSHDANFARRVAIEIHKRPALALACLLLGLTMLGVALVFVGVSRHLGLGVGIGVFFVYYVLLSAGMALAEGGVISAGVGVWTPNLLCAALAILLLRRAATERWIIWPLVGRSA